MGSHKPLRRQPLYQRHPCPTHRTQPLLKALEDDLIDLKIGGLVDDSPDSQEPGGDWASEDRVWRRYNPHKLRKNTVKTAAGFMGQHFTCLL